MPSPRTNQIRVVFSVDEQTRLWVVGESVHSDHRGLGPECCPDFSCCNPDLLQPIAVRKAFLVAGEKERHAFLMAFLGGMIAKTRPDVSVYIIDGEPKEDS